MTASRTPGPATGHARHAASTVTTADRSAAVYPISLAARIVGVSASALRQWERQGLLTPRRSQAGYRLYSEADVARLRRIRQMREERVNAPGIRRLLRPSETVPHPAPDHPDGRDLRAMRLGLGLSLREAGRRADLSASFISSVERNATGASVAALQRLTQAYDATLVDLFARPRAAGRHVRPAERPVLALDPGVRIEQLALGTTQLEPQLFRLDPGATSDGAYSHEGEEFLFVLDGALTVWVGDRERYRLTTGDALTFPSTLPHRWRNRTDGETRLLWINTPPTF
jgi:DNA-binding transcriptional MerR regulator/quercetin dioxygenase-like cupin family protein